MLVATFPSQGGRAAVHKKSCDPYLRQNDLTYSNEVCYDNTWEEEHVSRG